MKAGISHLACSSNRTNSLSKPYSSINLMKSGSPLPQPLLSRSSIQSRGLTVSLPRVQVRGKQQARAEAQAGLHLGQPSSVTQPRLFFSSAQTSSLAEMGLTSIGRQSASIERNMWGRQHFAAFYNHSRPCPFCDTAQNGHKDVQGHSCRETASDEHMNQRISPHSC